MAKGRQLGNESIRRLGRELNRSERASHSFPGNSQIERTDGINWLTFRNDANEMIPGRSVVVFPGYTSIDGSLERVGRATKPSTTFSRTLAVTGPEDTPKDGFGLLQLDGIMEVKYDTGTPLAGQIWGVKQGQWEISRYYPGFEILGSVSQTKTAFVRHEPIDSLLGKLDSSSTKGALSTVSIWGGTPVGEIDLGFNINAYNRFATKASGKWVIINYIHGFWYMSAAEC